MLFPTTLVGSYPQPEWLIDRKKLAGRFPPRVRARELWRIPDAHLAEAQDDATLLAIRADRKSTRLNSSHSQISYAVFCLKKKKQQNEGGPSIHFQSRPHCR